MANKPIFNNVWNNEYYDETDMFMYIGDVWVDEVVALGYTCIQEKTPIYGYITWHS